MTKIYSDSAKCCRECDEDFDVCSCRDGWNDLCTEHGLGIIVSFNDKTPITYRCSVLGH